MIMLPSSFQLETCIIIGDNHRSRDGTRNKKKGSNGMYFVNAMLYSSSTFRPSIKSIFVLEVSFDNVSSVAQRQNTVDYHGYSTSYNYKVFACFIIDHAYKHNKLIVT